MHEVEEVADWNCARMRKLHGNADKKSIVEAILQSGGFQLS